MDEIFINRFDAVSATGGTRASRADAWNPIVGQTSIRKAATGNVGHGEAGRVTPEVDRGVAFKDVLVNRVERPIRG